FIDIEHGSGYRLVATVTNISSDGPESSPLKNQRDQPTEPRFSIAPLYYEWNLPWNREHALARFSPELIQSPSEETEFVDFFDFVSDVDYKRSSGDIYLATTEFDEIWENKGIYVSYERRLVRYKNS